MRLEAFLEENIGSRNLKERASFYRGGNHILQHVSEPVEDRVSVLQSMSFCDQVCNMSASKYRASGDVSSVTFPLAR